MALGAFVAGLILAESEFRKAIEVTIDPFKALLLGMFFFTVGMGVDFREVAREPLLVLAAVVGLIGLKAVILIGLARLFGLTWPSSIEMGLLLGPGGEFAFVGIGLAGLAGLITARRQQLRADRDVAHHGADPAAGTARPAPVRAARSEAAGAGGAGRHSRPAVARTAPSSSGTAASARSFAPCWSGTATPSSPPTATPLPCRSGAAADARSTSATPPSPAFLKSCGVLEAPAVIVTIHDQHAIDEIVRVARSLRPDILIVSRARDATHARHLYAIGVTDAVPETIEASLQLSEAALVGLGLPTGPVIASIHEKRDEFRHELQEAAGQAGQTETRAIRASTSREVSRP